MSIKEVVDVHVREESLNVGPWAPSILGYFVDHNFGLCILLLSPTLRVQNSRLRPRRRPSQKWQVLVAFPAIFAQCLRLLQRAVRICFRIAELSLNMVVMRCSDSYSISCVTRHPGAPRVSTSRTKKKDEICGTML